MVGPFKLCSSLHSEKSREAENQATARDIASFYGIPSERVSIEEANEIALERWRMGSRERRKRTALEDDSKRMTNMLGNDMI
uniref:Stability/partitioning determinant n=1 Tax=Steinernema glaseri TaxID=37863 RepID=A0A1I7ZVM3_9BILA